MKEITLTEEQKQFILDNWSNLTLLKLTQKTFDNSELDGRSVEAKAIKEFLGTKKPKTSVWEKVELELTKEQKEFIENNLELRPIEIARIMFDNPAIEPLSKEVTLIRKYQTKISPKNTEDMPSEDYSPPTHLVHVVKKVNDFAQKELNLEEMSALQKKMMESLRGFLRSPRFLQMINSYVSKKSRQVFEEEFVRTTYDKPDLTPDELNLYVNLCSNYVLMININRQLDLINERYEREIIEEDSKVSMALAEMIKVKTDELNKCDKRQHELIESLSGKRAARKKSQGNDNMSVANLLEAWKDEDERQKALKRAELYRKAASEEVDRLESMSEWKARILGMSKDELLSG